MRPLLRFPQLEALAAEIDRLECLLGGELLGEALLGGMQPGEYFDRREQARFELAILHAARATSPLAEGRPLHIHAVPLARPEVVRQAQAALGASGAKVYLTLEASYENGLLGLELWKRVDGPDWLMGKRDEGERAVWVVADPGPLLPLLEEGLGELSVGERLRRTFSTFRPFEVRYAVAEEERLWLDRRVGQEVGAEFRLMIDLASPEDYWCREPLAGLVGRCAASGRIEKVVLEPGLVFVALPGPLLTVVPVYQAGGRRIDGRDLVKKLQGTEPDPLLMPLVDFLAASEMRESVPLGETQVYGEAGAVEVTCEAEVFLEPEGRIEAELVIGGSEEPREWLVAVTAVAGTYAGAGPATWPDMAEHAERLRSGEIWLLGFLDRWRFREQLEEGIEGIGWECHFEESAEPWHTENLVCWRQDGQQLFLSPLKAYIEILFHGRAVDKAIGARLQLLQARAGGTADEAEEP